MLCRRCFTKDAGADLYFLIQKNWHISVRKDLENFQVWQTFVTNLKVMGSHFFFKRACVRACVCMCVCVYFEESNKTKYIIVNDTPHQQLKLAI